MAVLQGLIIAVSTFSQLPTPKVTWEAKSLGWVLMFLPLIGVIIGVVLVAWYGICTVLPVPDLLRAVGYTVLPLLLTGAIHLDGFSDTSDALASNAGVARRQEILHDPHVGAFAVIAVVMYLMAFCGLASGLALSWASAVAFAAVFVMSRGLAGLATLHLPCTEASSFASALRSPQAKTPSTVVLVLWVLASAAAVVVCGGWPGAVALVVSAFIGALAWFWLTRQFDGFSGDLAGWLIQMVELGALAGLVFGTLIVAAL